MYSTTAGGRGSTCIYVSHLQFVQPLPTACSVWGAVAPTWHGLRPCTACFFSSSFFPFPFSRSPLFVSLSVSSFLLFAICFSFALLCCLPTVFFFRPLVFFFRFPGVLSTGASLCVYSYLCCTTFAYLTSLQFAKIYAFSRLFPFLLSSFFACI